VNKKMIMMSGQRTILK